MASLVRTKKSIFTISVLITVALWVSESTWVHPLVIKKWNQNSLLTWDDFVGQPPMITSFDAAISSKVYGTPDSLGGYEIYAGQNNRQSWTKYREDADELLRHEQYHFNITELHARMLKELALEDSGDLGRFEISKFWIDQKLDDMQNEYDEASQHGINEAYQTLWEFKVDSLLSSHEDHQGYYTDHYGGTKIWFPTRPEHLSESTEYALSDCYTTSYYGSDLIYCIYHDADYGDVGFLRDWQDFLEEDYFEIHQMTHVQGTDYEQLELIYDDTIFQWRYHQKVLYVAPYEYRLNTIFPLDKDSLVYGRMRSSFLNHFSFESQDDFWRSKGREKDPQPWENQILEIDESDNNDGYQLSRLPYSDHSVLYHRPIKEEDQLIIPFKIVRHPIEDVEEIMYLINEARTFTQAPDSIDQLIKIDLKLLDKGENKIQFGYTASSDSTANGYHFYSAIVTYDHLP